MDWHYCSGLNKVMDITVRGVFRRDDFSGCVLR